MPPTTALDAFRRRHVLDGLSMRSSASGESIGRSRRHAPLDTRGLASRRARAGAAGRSHLSTGAGPPRAPGGVTLEQLSCSASRAHSGASLPRSLTGREAIYYEVVRRVSSRSILRKNLVERPAERGSHLASSARRFAAHGGAAEPAAGKVRWCPILRARNQVSALFWRRAGVARGRHVAEGRAPTCRTAHTRRRTVSCREGPLADPGRVLCRAPSS